MEMILDEKVSGMGMYKLGDLCSDVVDCPHSTPEWKNEGIRVIRNFNIVNGSLDFSNGFFVDEETFEKRTQRACPEFEDLVISREAPMGAVCMIPKNLKCCLGQRLVLLKVNKDVADPNYILFAIQSQFVQKQIQIIDQTGSIVSNLNIPDLKSLRIPLPSLPEQKKIASVLSALDDKIALNKKMNQKLEAMAKRLYDYWFVQFDFPDKNGHPYKTTGGPMTYNPTLKREIPAGWEVGSFGDCIQLVSNRVDPRDVKKDDFYTPIEVIPKRQMSLDECAPIEDATSGLCSYDKKNILLSNRRVYFHKVCIAPFSGLTRDTVIIFRPKTMENLGFVYQVVNSDHFIEYATVNSYGSEQPVLSWPTVQNYKIVKPPQKIMLEYSERVKDIIDHVLNIQLENIKLKNMRDKLLPLLMNGQVVVG